MSHPYKKEATSGHAKKLAGYGAKSSAKNWAGDSALNTDKQAGMEIIEEEPSMSKKTMDRIMRKAGGAVKGKEAAKRLDKGSRKGKRMKAADGLPPIDEQLKSAERLGEIRARRADEDRPTREAVESINRKQRYSIEDLAAPGRKKGGKVSEMEWEHSKKDLAEDRKLAKKHGMPLEKWEKSKLDEKHDKQQSMEGLKKGGRACRGSGGPVAPKTKIYNSSENNVTKSARSGVRMGALTEAAKTTDRVKKFGGGGLSDDGAKGKKPSRATNLTINIGNPGQDMTGMPQAMARPMPQAPAMPPAAPPMPAPMPAGGPMGGMPPMAGGMGGLPPMGGAPMLRQKGGRVRTTDDLTAGAGSGEGRLEKVELQQSMKGKRP